MTPVAAMHPAALEAERVRRRLQARMFGVAAPALRVDRFELTGRIGHGAHGEVFEARDLRLDRTIALKLLFGPVGDAEAVRAEARALALLSHPNVVTVFDAGVTTVELGAGRSTPRYFIAMERVEGLTADRWRHAAPRSPSEVLAVYLAAGAGLVAAHAAGIVHGDFKPQNVIVGDDGRVRVLDFGLAHRSTTSGAGRPRGTPGYMAPEAREGRVDARSDQFGFCASLWQALGGRMVGAAAPTTAAVETAPAGASWSSAAPAYEPAGGSDRSTDVVDVERDAPRVPARIVRALRRGLRPEPERRWPSMEALLERLSARPRRRHVAWALVPAGVAAWLWWLSPGDAPSCDDATEELAGTWDAERIHRLHARFEGSALPYAADAWATVRARIDAHAAQWLDARRTLCEQARRGDDDVRARVDRQRACLHERLRALATTLDALAEADALAIRHAPRTVAELPGVATCLESPDDPLHPSPSQASAVAEARAELLHARELTRRGDHDGAARQAEAALQAAETLGFAPLRAEARLRLGLALAQARRDARPVLEAALWEANAIGHDAVEAKAAGVLARLAMSEADYDTAARLVRQAEVAAERHGDDLVQADVLREVGTLARQRGRYDEALDAFERALARLEPHRASLGLELAALQREIGLVCSERGEHPAALAAFERALAEAEALLGPKHPELADYLHSMGVVHEEQNRLDDARAAFERALSLVDATEPTTYPLHNGLGIVLERQGHHEQAARSYERARAQVEALHGSEHPLAASLHVNLGTLMAMLRRFDESLGHYRRAVAIFDGLGSDGRRGLTLAYDGLGRTLSELGRRPDAARAFEAAVRVGKAGGLAPAVVGIARMDLAFTRFALGAPWAEIHRELTELEAIFAAAGPGHEDELADVRDWLAEHPRPLR